MSEEVELTVCGIHGEEGEIISRSARGRYAFRNGAHLLRWEQDGTGHLLQWTKESLQLTRFGELRSIMRFLPGVRTHTDYRSGAGVLPLEIETKSVEESASWDKTEDASFRPENWRERRVRVVYALYSRETWLQDSSFTVTIRPVVSAASGDKEKSPL